MNGSAADPAMPMPATRPTQPVRSQRGRIWVICDTRSGNIGPMTTPIIDTYIPKYKKNIKVEKGAMSYGDSIADDGRYKPDREL
jgi:hypothetical protein